MTPRFIKQYGERRTGTNWLRMLLASHFSGVEVLIHVLGDKHEAAADLAQLQRMASLPGADDEWLRQATLARPAETTNLEDPVQADYLRAIAGPLRAAVLQESLLCVVSIKHPYAWAYSMLKIQGWRPGRQRERTAGQAYGQYLKDACLQFNRKYAAWLALVDHYPRQSCLIRYEDLLQDEDTVLREIGRRCGLQPHEARPVPVAGIVLPTHWDHCATSAHYVKFDRAFYLQRQYLAETPPLLLRIVAETIDWQPLQQVGYRANL